MSNPTLLALCNTVFSLPVKSNSDQATASTRCNRAVIPADGWEEHPSINIHTHYQTGFRLILNLKPSTVCLCISLFDLLSLIQSSHRITPPDEWQVVTGCFNQRHRGEVPPPPLVFFISRSGWLVDVSSFVLSPRVTSALTWLQLMVTGTGSQETLQHYI